jgi:hypothetical protein
MLLHATQIASLGRMIALLEKGISMHNAKKGPSRETDGF